MRWREQMEIIPTATGRWDRVVHGVGLRIRIADRQIYGQAAVVARLSGSDLLRDSSALAIADRFRLERHRLSLQRVGDPGAVAAMSDSGRHHRTGIESAHRIVDRVRSVCGCLVAGEFVGTMPTRSAIGPLDVDDRLALLTSDGDDGADSAVEFDGGADPALRA